MASDSISKLAVVLTGDGSPLSAALQKSLNDADKWALGMARISKQAATSWTNGMANIRMGDMAGPGGPMEAFDPSRLNRIPEAAKLWEQGFISPLSQINTAAKRAGESFGGLHAAAFKMNTVMSALRGNLGAAFSVGGPALLGIAAMSAAVYKLAAAGDTLMQKLGADKLDTWAGQWERVNEQLGIMGTTFTTIAAEASGGLADALAAVNEAMFPDSVAYTEALKARQAANKKAIEDGKRIEEQNKRQLELNRKAAEEQQRERDAMLDRQNSLRDRGEAIRDSVMSPGEEMRRTFQELRQLLAGGFIDEETAMRAGMKARKAFDEAGGKKTAEESRAGVGAADRFSMAGFSAVQQGLRDLAAKDQTAKDQLEELKRQTKVEEEIAKILSGQTPIVLHEGNPP